MVGISVSLVVIPLLSVYWPIKTCFRTYTALLLVCDYVICNSHTICDVLTPEDQSLESGVTGWLKVEEKKKLRLHVFFRISSNFLLFCEIMFSLQVFEGPSCEAETELI